MKKQITKITHKPTPTHPQRVVHENINERLREAIADGGREPLLSEVLAEAEAAGMGFDDPQDYPFAVQAFRMRSGGRWAAVKDIGIGMFFLIYILDLFCLWDFNYP